jgi:hypothetical protein
VTVPRRDPDPTDPMTRTGVEIPADLDEVEAMARAFAEEFAATGCDEEQLLEMFQRPFYAGPHLAWTQLGEAKVRAVIAEAVRPWRRFHA